MKSDYYTARILWILLMTTRSLSSITGYHLRCCCMEVLYIMKPVRDSSGRVVSTTGIIANMLEWLAEDLNWTYECTKWPERVENSTLGVGVTHHIQTGECEVVAAPMVLQYARFKYFDFLQPNSYEEFVLTIPMPAKTSGSKFLAMLEPFEPKAWITLFVIIIIAALALAGLDRIVNGQRISSAFRKAAMFAWRVLLSQGDEFWSVKLTLRLVAGAWCLLGFFWINAYSSVLISFITAPKYVPLVDSVQELVDSSRARPVVVYGYPPDSIISSSSERLMVKLREKMNQDPHSRCNNVPDCFSQVKDGRTVFIHGHKQINFAMNFDYENTGLCNYAVAREIFHTSHLSLGITKNHMHYDLLNRRLLRMVEVGMIDTWLANIKPKNRRCMDEAEKMRQPSPELLRLSLRHLSGSFLILLIGYVIAFAAFLVERIFVHLRKRKLAEASPH